MAGEYHTPLVRGARDGIALPCRQDAMRQTTVPMRQTVEHQKLHAYRIAVFRFASNDTDCRKVAQAGPGGSPATPGLVGRWCNHTYALCTGL